MINIENAQLPQPKDVFSAEASTVKIYSASTDTTIYGG